MLSAVRGSYVNRWTGLDVISLSHISAPIHVQF